MYYAVSNTVLCGVPQIPLCRRIPGFLFDWMYLLNFFYFLLLAFARQPSVVEADPFLAFSTEDIEGMDKEVASILTHINTFQKAVDPNSSIKIFF